MLLFQKHLLIFPCSQRHLTVSQDSLVYCFHRIIKVVSNEHPICSLCRSIYFSFRNLFLFGSEIQKIILSFSQQSRNICRTWTSTFSPLFPLAIENIHLIILRVHLQKIVRIAKLHKPEFSGSKFKYSQYWEETQNRKLLLKIDELFSLATALKKKKKS